MKKQLKKFIVLAVALCLVSSILLTGCASTGTPESSGGAESSEAVAESSEAAPASSEAASESSEAAPESSEAAPVAAGGGDELVEQCVAEAAMLSDMDAVNYWNGLKSEKGLTDDQIIQFFIDLPLSDANPQVKALYEDEGFEASTGNYPKADMYEGYVWEKGEGVEATGEVTGNSMKLPYSDDYVPVDAGPIGDPSKTYRIGVMNLDSGAWLGDLSDSIYYEAARHENVELIPMMYEGDMNKYSTQMDTLIADGVDAIIIWPLIEASAGPAVERAEAAGIPCITVDRTTSWQDVTCRITGNFPANGAQMGMYTVWALAKETNGESVAGNVVLIRKPAGSTADATRCGYALKVLSYMPGINILQSYFNQTDGREEALMLAQSALQAYDDIDVMITGDEAMACTAYEACKEADRLTKANGERMIITGTDESREYFHIMDDYAGIDMCAPYTPFIGDIGMRAAVKILDGEDVPQDIATPNIPMVTLDGAEIFGLQTMTTADWSEYVWGAEY